MEWVDVEKERRLKEWLENDSLSDTSVVWSEDPFGIENPFQCILCALQIATNCFLEAAQCLSLTFQSSAIGSRALARVPAEELLLAAPAPSLLRKLPQ